MLSAILIVIFLLFDSNCSNTGIINILFYFKFWLAKCSLTEVHTEKILNLLPAEIYGHHLVVTLIMEFV